jgi:GAF domain-containing protein
MTDTSPFDDLLAAVDEIVAETDDRDGALQAICDLLRASVAHYDWVGFYLADNQARALVLGPFAGAPTGHVRIAFGQGICGQAAERRETFIVQDVSREANYLACSPEVRSEIVLPVVSDGRLVAELDIDSHALAPFTDADRAFLADVAAAVAELF